MLIFGIVGIVLGAGLLFAGRRQKSLQAEMQKTKVSPINQVQEGVQTEVYGKALTSQPLKTPFSGRDCVYYQYKLERQVQRAGTDGRTQTSWETIAQDRQQAPFWIEDATGRIAVDPQDADIDAEKVGEQFVRQNDIMNLGLSHLNLGSLGSYTRATEYALYANSNVYAMGQVARSQDALMLVKGNGKMFLSYKTEDQVEKERGRSAMLWTVFGVVFGIAGVVLVVMSFLQ